MDGWAEIFQLSGLHEILGLCDDQKFFFSEKKGFRWGPARGRGGGNSHKGSTAATGQAGLPPLSLPARSWARSAAHAQRKTGHGACAGEGQADMAHAHYAPYKTRRIWANQTWPWGECLSSGLEWEMSIREFDFSSDVLNVTFDYHIIFNTDCWQNKISLLQWWNWSWVVCAMSIHDLDLLLIH